ncbi:MAG: PEP-CTERM sorting domain-containing protein [Phycisphaerales bacterium]|nr:PEP-CTERM sorting domain-containing protein [Phycisphaerales bacterium]MCB9862096.1 PEP-CTERM sorting domain-containing protein [Phycisphaerales bacterium]
MLREHRLFALAGISALSVMSFAAKPLIGSEVFSVMPSEDTFSRAELPGATYGTAGALHVSGNLATNGVGVRQGLADSWMRFDASSAINQFDLIYGAGNWTLESAVLSVRENAAPTSDIFTRGVGDFGVAWIANDNWSQGTGAASSPGTASGNEIGWTYGQSLLSAADRSLGVFQNAGNNTRQDFGLTLDADFVADLLADASTTLRLSAASDGIGFTFNSADNANMSNRPTLTLTATPEPASAILLLSAGIAFLKRRHR